MAKLVKPEKDKVDVGFQLPAGGAYIWQFLDEIEFWKAENKQDGGESKSISINLKAIIEDVAQDWPNNKALESEIGQTQIIKIFIQGKDGKELTNGITQISAVLAYTGLLDEFVKKMGEDIDLTSEQFMIGLQKKLPGKKVGIDHTISERNNMKNFNIQTFFKAGSGGGASAGVKKEEKSGGEDW